MAEKQRPGVMLYFDSIRPALNRLNDLQAGMLFRAILTYAEFGEISELDDKCGMAFEMLKPKIDHDAESYAETQEKRKYAAYRREAKRFGVFPLEFEDWLKFKNTPLREVVQNQMESQDIK